MNALARTLSPLAGRGKRLRWPSVRPVGLAAGCRRPASALGRTPSASAGLGRRAEARGERRGRARRVRLVRRAHRRSRPRGRLRREQLSRRGLRLRRRAATPGSRSRSSSRATASSSTGSARPSRSPAIASWWGPTGPTPIAAQPTSSSGAAAPGPRSRSSSRATGSRATTSAGPCRSPAIAPWSGPTEATPRAARPTSSSATAAPWTEEQKLVASDGACGRLRLLRRARPADRALVGAPGRTLSRRGPRLRPKRGGSSWTEEQELVASDGTARQLRHRRLARRRPRAGGRVLGRRPSRRRLPLRPNGGLPDPPGPRNRSSSRATGRTAIGSAAPSRSPPTAP